MAVCLISSLGEAPEFYIPTDKSFECIFEYGERLCILIKCRLKNGNFESLPIWISSWMTEEK